MLWFLDKVREQGCPSVSLWCDILRYILLVGDREKDMRTERCVFFSETSTSQHRNVVLHHTHTLTLTNTLTLSHTHMTGQPGLVGQVVPEEFFRVFATYFWTKVVSKTFFGRQGVTQHPKIFSSECIKCFVCLCMYLYAGTMLQSLRLC